MAEYIEKDALIKQAEKSWLYFGVLSVIREVPAADVAPMVHGRWIVKGQDIFCSHCSKESGYNAFGASKFSDYCPNCGAMMDLENETEEK